MANKNFIEFDFDFNDEVPEQCQNCEYHKFNVGFGWCYMFQDKPTEECKQFKQVVISDNKFNIFSE